MEKINIAKILKDCPSGMELDCTLLEDLEFDGIVDNKYVPIRCRVKNPNGGYYVYNFTKYGCWFNTTFAKCAIFPKGKTTWEGFVPPCQFKDGDIISDAYYDAICIFKDEGNIKGTVDFYCGISYDNSDELLIKDVKDQDEHFGEINEYKLATEEEKEKLFNVIKANGYKWNPETKTLEKLIGPKFKVGDIIQDIDTYKVKITEVNIYDECYSYESIIAKGIGSIAFNEQDDWELVPNKFDITTLVPFESRVLVRSGENCFWKPAIFGFYSTVNFYMLGGIAWSQCIPYEGNEHLLGTADDCTDFYKTWE